MKKIILTLMISLVGVGNSFAQTPQAFKYQAVARDNLGELIVNQLVAVQISILEGSISGSAVYVESHQQTANQFGLISLEIGNGLVSIGDFTSINWRDNLYFLQIEMDVTGGTNYQLLGTSQLLSVPYALYAEKSGGSDMWNKNNMDELYYNNGHIGIGTSNPSYELDIIDATGEAYARVRSNIASSSLLIDKYSIAHMGQIVYQQNHVNKFYTGLLGNNYYRISADHFSLKGLEVQATGRVVFSDGIYIHQDCGVGKVLTSDQYGNASWQGGPQTKYLTIPGVGFINNEQVMYPTDNHNGFVTANVNSQWVYLMSPVMLPEGAIITEIRISVFDYTDDDFYIDFKHLGSSTSPGIPQVGLDIVSIHSSGEEYYDRYFFADLSGIDMTIEMNYSYYLDAHWYSPGNNLYMALKEVRFSYVESQ